MIDCVSVLSVGAVIEGVNELREREFPSLAKEGCREAAGVSGANASPIGRSNEKRFDQEIHYWTSTTPALSRHPSSAEEANFNYTPISQPNRHNTLATVSTSTRFAPARFSTFEIS